MMMRERHVFEAEMIAAQQRERRIGEDVDWRGLGPKIVSIGEYPSFARSFVWDVRRDDGELKLFVSASRTAGSGFLAPGYRQQIIVSVDLEEILTSIATVRLEHWHPDPFPGGTDGTNREVSVYRYPSFISLRWRQGQEPPQWRELTDLASRLIERFKRTDLVPNAYAFDSPCDARTFFEESARDVPFASHVPFSERRPGVHVAAGLSQLAARQKPRFVLAVYSAAMTDDLRRRIPQALTVGAVDDMVTMVQEGRPGIPIAPVMNPARLPRDWDAAYFELDPTSPSFKALARLNAVAIHVAPGFPALRMELWTVSW